MKIANTYNKIDIFLNILSSQNSNKVFFIEFLLIFFLKVVIDFAYYQITNLIGECGASFCNFEFNIIKYLFSYFIVFLIYSILVFKRALRVLPIFLIIFILFIIPSTTYFGLSNGNYFTLFIIVIPFIAIVFLTFNFSFNLNKIKKININYIFYLCFLFTLLVVIHLANSSNGDFVISFANVYEFRAKYETISSQNGGGYFINWAFKITSLTLLVISIYKRSIFFVLISLLLICALFMFSGHKIVFLSIFAILFFYILFKINYNRVIILFLFLIFFMTVTSVSLLLGDYNMIGSVFIRRLLFVQPILASTYVDFFSNNQFVYWSYSFLSSFFEYPYDKNYGLLIGEYLNMPTANAVSGFLSTGYMNAGMFGVFVYVLLAILIFNYVNILITKEMKFLQLSIVFIPIYTFFVEADILTTLLTHGLFIALLLVLLLKSKEHIKAKK